MSCAVGDIVDDHALELLVTAVDDGILLYVRDKDGLFVDRAGTHGLTTTADVVRRCVVHAARLWASGIESYHRFPVPVLPFPCR